LMRAKLDRKWSTISKAAPAPNNERKNNELGKCYDSIAGQYDNWERLNSYATRRALCYFQNPRQQPRNGGTGKCGRKPVVTPERVKLICALIARGVCSRRNSAANREGPGITRGLNLARYFMNQHGLLFRLSAPGECSQLLP
jgi:hypothetical protein